MAVIANGIGTIFGVISLAPSGAAWRIGAVITGIGLHVIISRIELAYIQWRYLLSWFIVPLIGAVVLDIGTSIQGFLWTVQTLFPALFATNLPADVWLWGPLFQSLAAQTGGLVRELAGERVDWRMLEAPTWAGRAWVILLVISSVSIGSERLLHWSYRNFREVWELRR